MAIFRRGRESQPARQPQRRQNREQPSHIAGGAKRVTSKVEGEIVTTRTTKTLRDEQRIPLPQKKKKKGEAEGPREQVIPALIEETDSTRQGSRFRLPALPLLGRALEQLASFRSRLNIEDGTNINVTAQPTIGTNAGITVDESSSDGTRFDKATITGAGFFENAETKTSEGSDLKKRRYVETRQGRVQLDIHNFRGNGGANLSADGVSFEVNIGYKNPNADDEE